MTDFIFIDMETAYDKDYSLTKMTYEQYLRDERFRIHGMGYKVNDQATEYVYGEQAIIDTCAELFPDGNTNVSIAHNALFDGAILEWRLGFQAHQYFCTQAMSRMLWNQRESSLEQLAISCFPDDKSVRKTKELIQFKGVLDELTPEQQAVMGRYCKNDVEVTFKCFARMYAWLEDEAFQIMDMMLKMFIQPAFVLDRERVAAYLEKVKQESEETIKAAGVPKSILASNDKFAQWILDQGIPFEKIPAPTPKNPSNKKWPLAKNSMEFLQLQTDYPQFAHVWDGRIAAKSTIEQSRAERLLDHSMPSIINPDCRIALPLNPSAAHTHRAGGTNKINPQNFKRGGELRRSLYAPRNHMIVVADLSNIERRMLAWFFEETSVLTAYAQNRDLYCEFASDAYGYTVTKKNHPTERYLGKVCELSLGYGVGHRKLQVTLATGAMGGPRLYFALDRCQGFVHTWRTRNPYTTRGWRVCNMWIQSMIEKGTQFEHKCLTVETGRIRLPNGLYLNYPDLHADELPTGGYEFSYWNGEYRTRLYGAKLVENLIQALAQVLLRWQMIEIQRRLSEIGGRIALQVHDEVIAVVPERHADVSLQLMIDVMRTQPDWLDDGTLTLDAEGGIAYNYSK